MYLVTWLGHTSCFFYNISYHLTSAQQFGIFCSIHYVNRCLSCIMTTNVSAQIFISQFKCRSGVRQSLLVLQPQMGLPVPAADDEWELWCYSNWQGRECLISLLSTKNSTWSTSQLTPVLCGENPVTKHLSFSMSLQAYKLRLKTL